MVIVEPQVVFGNYAQVRRASDGFYLMRAVGGMGFGVDACVKNAARQHEKSVVFGRTENGSRIYGRIGWRRVGGSRDCPRQV